MYVGIFNPLSGSHRVADLTEKKIATPEFTYWWRINVREHGGVRVHCSYPRHNVVIQPDDMTVTIEHLKFRVFDRRDTVDEWLHAQCLGG